MHRSSRGLAAIFLVGWVATAPGASAEEAKSTTLPAVEVEAPSGKVVDTIASTRTGAQDRPAQDITITSVTVERIRTWSP